MKRVSEWIGVMAFLFLTQIIVVLPLKAQDTSRTPEGICASAMPVIPETRSYESSDWVLNEGIDYRVIFCTAAGAIYLDLFEEVTPVTVNNFVFLAQNGYYDGTTFHRVLENFMAQGGDPTGTGRGGPGYQFEDEFEGFLTFDRPGLLAMANANNPDRGIFGTNGSQFFITFGETSWLNYRHTIFGEVLTGKDALQGLRLCDPANCSEGDALNVVIVITDPALVEEEIPKRAHPDPSGVPTQFENFFTDRNITDVQFGAGYFTAEEMRATARRADDDALLEYLSEYGLEYRITTGFETCEASYAPLRSFRSALMSFPDEDAAQAALQNDYWLEAEASGLESVRDITGEIFTPDEVYIGGSDLCEDGQTQRAWMMYRYGRVLIRVEASYEMNASGSDVALRWLSNSQFFSEPYFSEIIRDSLWGN